MRDLQFEWSAWITKREKYRFGAEVVYEFLREAFPNTTRILHLLYLPSFEPVQSYHLLDHRFKTKDTNQRFEVMRISWDLHSDLPRVLTDQPPNLLVKTAFVPSTLVDDIFKPFQHPIPFWMSPGWEENFTGYDGAIYEVELGGFFLGVRLHWWSHSPEEWLPLTEAFNFAVNEFEKLLQ